MIGEKLGPYEILESLGSGGMGEVWKARDSRLGRKVAIKKVKEQHSERFKQEARSIAALNHPNICQIHDIGPDYLVLEYVEGKPLSSPLQEQEAIRLAIQIATALEAAHKKGIIHRDLKPSNIMVTDEGAVKLLDFGLAKLYEQEESISSLPTADIPATQAGAILGTVAYMSPEQAQGKPADARSDIFSFGLVLYEMLSGRRAFSGNSNYAIMNSIVKEEPLPLQTSSSMGKIVRRCLAKLPTERFQLMAEVRKALDQVGAKPIDQEKPSIAVLPFVNMSGDKEQEYFSDGLAEEIINALTKIKGLRVIARTSSFAFRGKEQDIRRIAEALSVTNILEGSVRKSGNRIRVTAQLITASDGSHLWSERYDRDLTDVFAIQDEIATAITGALKVELLIEPAPQRRHEPSLAAHEAYLKARYLWGKISLEPMAQAREYLEQAISLDPKYALARLGLADHFLTLAAAGYTSAHEAMPVVREEAQRALEIDSSLPEAYAMLGLVAAVYEFNWKESEKLFQLAMAYEPVPSRVHEWYGLFYLYCVGRMEDAVEQTEKAVKGDPLRATSRMNFMCSLFGAGRLVDAQAEAHKVLEFSPDLFWATYVLALTSSSREDWIKVLHIAEKGATLVPATGIIAAILKHIGEHKQAEKLIQNLLPGEAYGAAVGLVSYYILCREIDKAAHWAEKAIEQRYPGINFLLTPLRSSPQWPALAKLMNLPEEV